MDRRAFLAACAALLANPALSRAANSAASVRLAAAWQGAQGYQVGVLEQRDALRIHSAIDVPTRAHALLQEPGGTLLAVARRPGDWLLRWDPTGKPLAWRWIEPRRAFTGHVVSDGKTLYVAETDLDTGEGLIGVRDALTLEKRAEWPTHGIDPHQLLWDVSHPGALIVANGGVPTRPETGRTKVDLESMDSSLVRIDAASGELLGQWRLSDRRLSLRHLAWNGERLGIALQAEHDDVLGKVNAPVLAVFDGELLRLADTSTEAATAFAGYGGDIAPAGDGFAVSCPRTHGIALFAANGSWRRFIPLAEACALTSFGDRLLIGGRSQALKWQAETLSEPASIAGIRLDNHWVCLT